MSSSSVEAITLESSDGGEFKMTVSAVMLSNVLNEILGDDFTSHDCKLEQVNSKTLVKVIEYCEKHAPRANSGASDSDAEELKKWDVEFMKVDVEDTLFDILQVAHYLDIEGLYDLACQTVADLMKGKTITQIRKIFHLKNDFSTEEQEQLRRQHPGCTFD